MQTLAKDKSDGWQYRKAEGRNMEQVLLEAEEQIKVPSIKEFREFIDERKWQKKHEEIFVKLIYLLGSRASETITKVTPYMLQHGMSKPYGQLLSWELANYRKPDGKEIQLLLVTSAIAKRKKTKKDPEQTETSPQQTITEQQPIKVKTKIVPIVCDLVAEPWCIDVLRWIQFQKGSPAALRFNFTEMTLQNIVRRNLAGFDYCFKKPERMHVHALRHFRITHLIQGYNFTPYQISAFTGWSIKSVSGQMGIQASSNIDIYSHLMWKDYVDKLLVPLSEVL